MGAFLALKSWHSWLVEHWEPLCAGEPITVEPGGELAHPAIADGWHEVFIAEPFGQRADWAYPLPDGSRLHMHEHANRWVIHRDKHDPGRGIGPAVRHYLEEAPTAKIAVAGSLAGLALQAAKRILLPCLLGLVGFTCGSCHGPPAAPDDLAISKQCETDYVSMVAIWSYELAVTCAPHSVEECGAPRDKVNAKWDAKFAAWEKRCSE